ncbi:MAG TPA: efflux RND transporter periplasmic adaptor subunit [bacterium]|nr:efflux RND transporter periplasmic adaptor subunit [bacterium]
MADLKGELASLRIDRDAPRRNPWRWPLLLAVPALLLILVLWGLRLQRTVGTPEVSVVTASAVAPGEDAPSAALLTASGYVVARRQAVVSAKIQGRLAELKVEEGSRVEKGDVIARLENADFRARVAQAEAGVARAEADLAEQRRLLRLAAGLRERNLGSEDDEEAALSRVRIAEAALAQASATLDLARAQLEDTVIRAPFAGVIVKKMAEVGESVAPIPPGVNLSTSSGAIVALADLATLEVEADVSESNVARLGAEQPADVTVEAFPDKRYRSVLRQVIPTADRTKATVQVKVTILEDDPALKPEMSARVTFLEKAVEKSEASESQQTSKPVVTVPANTLADRDGRTVVWEVRDGRVRERAVTAAGQRDGRVVIKEGLSGGEILVAAPPSGLEDGDAVRVQGR